MAATVETHKFSAETGKILQLMIHSLYAHKDIFLRELISNASDACDKLRYESIAKPELLKNDTDLKIQIIANEKDNTLTIFDNGIGMSKTDIINNIGSIASSGTQKFLDSMTGDNKKDIKLIGQFGVGFYSSYMVASEVDIYSCKAGAKKVWKWSSKADGEYTLEESKEKLERGTKIVLKLNDDSKEFTDKHRITHIIKTYSDHVSFPVEFTDGETDAENINEGSALWTKQKSKITDEQYNEFYKHVAHGGDEPWMVLHNKAEGMIEYTNLLFIPSNRPFDLFHPERKTSVKLYVKRVFISEENNNLLPQYLRFVKGIVDSEDLPLNISRETLQHNNLIHKIRNSITKKILSELKKKAEKDSEEFNKFWDNFGAILKEGLCEGNDSNRELLLDVCRFKTTKSGDKLISLDEYIQNMQEDQNCIYYLTGDDIETLKKSPQLEGFLKKDIEVILLCDSVDDFWVNVNHEYKDKELKSITRSGIDLDKSDDDKADKKDDNNDSKNEALADDVIALFKKTLEDKVADVISSKKLSNSSACLSVPEGGMDIRMEKFLIDQKQLAAKMPKILELNPKHDLVQFVANNKDSEITSDIIELIFDQACIVEGESISDTNAFSQRLDKLLKKAIAA